MKKIQEYWFDTRDGALLVGEAAVEERLTEAGPLVEPLRDLLLTKNFPFNKSDYEKADFRTRTNEEYLEFGRWVLPLITSDEGEQLPLHLSHLKRLYILGLGPEPETISYDSRFGNLTNFQKLIGSPNQDTKPFASWPLLRFIDHVRDIYNQVGRRPKWQDYVKAGVPWIVPSGMYMHYRFGGITLINELAGFPDFSLYNQSDCLEWSVEVMKSNPGVKLSQKLISTLSSKGKGPSYYKIVDVFTTWPNFIEKSTIAASGPSSIYIPNDSEFKATINKRFDVSDAVLPANFESLTYAEKSSFDSHFLLSKVILNNSRLASSIAARHIVSEDSLAYILDIVDAQPTVRLKVIKDLSEEFGTKYPTAVWADDPDYYKVT